MDYKHLPDGLMPDEIRPFILTELAQSEEITKLDLVKQLYYLSLIQGDTGESLETDLMEKVFNTYLGLIDYESVEMMSFIMPTIPGFGLIELYHTIMSKLTEIHNKEVVEMILDYQSQFRRFAKTNHTKFWQELKP